MSSTEKPCILAVEDNSETQLLLEHLLKQSFEVVVVPGVEVSVLERIWVRTHGYRLEGGGKNV